MSTLSTRLFASFCHNAETLHLAMAHNFRPEYFQHPDYEAAFAALNAYPGNPQQAIKSYREKLTEGAVWELANANRKDSLGIEAIEGAVENLRIAHMDGLTSQAGSDIIKESVGGKGLAALSRWFQVLVTGITKGVGSMQAAREAALKDMHDVIAGKTGAVIPGLEEFGSLKPGEMMTLAARPSHGKTSYTIYLAVCNALAGRPTIYVTTEMSSSEVLMLAAIILQHFDGKDEDHMFSKTLIDQGYEFAFNSMTKQREPVFALKDKPEIVQEYTDYIDRILALPFLIVDGSSRPANTVEVEAAVASFKALHKDNPKEPLVIIDFLQQISLPSSKGGYMKKDDAYWSDLAYAIKQIALIHHVCIIVVAALSRATDSRTNPRPQESDIRSMGALEYAANRIYLLYNRSKQFPGEQTVPKNMMEVIVAKNRKGEVGAMFITFVGRVGFFRKANDAEKETYSEYFTTGGK